MTNYNDGNWYGWNGGECPVNPKTLVEALYPSGLGSTGIACNRNWTSPLLFRVIKENKEPKEPREFWLKGACVFGSKDKALEYTHGWTSDFETIHVREVIKEEGDV